MRRLQVLKLRRIWFLVALNFVLVLLAFDPSVIPHHGADAVFLDTVRILDTNITSLQCAFVHPVLKWDPSVGCAGGIKASALEHESMGAAQCVGASETPLKRKSVFVQI